MRERDSVRVCVCVREGEYEREREREREKKKPVLIGRSHAIPEPEQTCFFSALQLRDHPQPSHRKTKY